MILLLIDHYNQIIDNDDNEDNIHKKELNEIFNFNSKLLNEKDNEIKINQYGLKLEDIKSKKIEEIYLIIIKYLIENSKLEDSEYIESIINQIELESINLTKLMFDELITILKKEKEYIKKYEIENFENIFNEKKINFYYNFIKYILKQYLYIYQIPFLLETRAKILNLIKNNLKTLFTSSIEKNKNKYKIDNILGQFFGKCSYTYYYKISESIIKKSQSNNYEQNFYDLDDASVKDIDESMSNDYENKSYKSSSGPFSGKSFSFKNLNSSFENDFDDEEEFNENELEYKILNNSKFTLHTNRRGKIPFIIYDEIKIIKKGKEIENKTIEEVRKATTNNQRLSNNYKKFLSFLDKFETSLSKEFINNYKLKITLNFETKNIKNDDFIISCLYDVEIPGENNVFCDENILINGFGDGYQYMLNEINSSNYSNIEYF